MGNTQRRPNYLKEYYSNPERAAKRLENSLKWTKENPDRQKQIYRNWSKRNHYYRAYMSAKRRAQKIQATPKWLTGKQLKEIENIYRNCPKGYEVDHIIPLNNPLVCGLHVPWNLQIITEEENRKKGNSFVPLS